MLCCRRFLGIQLLICLNQDAVLAQQGLEAAAAAAAAATPSAASTSLGGSSGGSTNAAVSRQVSSALLQQGGGGPYHAAQLPSASLSPRRSDDRYVELKQIAASLQPVKGMLLSGGASQRHHQLQPGSSSAHHSSAAAAAAFGGAGVGGGGSAASSVVVVKQREIGDCYIWGSWADSDACGAEAGDGALQVCAAPTMVANTHALDITQVRPFVMVCAGVCVCAFVCVRPVHASRHRPFEAAPHIGCAQHAPPDHVRACACVCTPRCVAGGRGRAPRRAADAWRRGLHVGRWAWRHHGQRHELRQQLPAAGPCVLCVSDLQLVAMCRRAPARADTLASRMRPTRAPHPPAGDAAGWQGHRGCCVWRVVQRGRAARRQPAHLGRRARRPAGPGPRCVSCCVAHARAGGPGGHQVCRCVCVCVSCGVSCGVCASAGGSQAVHGCARQLLKPCTPLTPIIVPLLRWRVVCASRRAPRTGCARCRAGPTTQQPSAATAGCSPGVTGCLGSWATGTTAARTARAS